MFPACPTTGARQQTTLVEAHASSWRKVIRKKRCYVNARSIGPIGGDRSVPIPELQWAWFPFWNFEMASPSRDRSRVLAVWPEKESEQSGLLWSNKKTGVAYVRCVGSPSHLSHHLRIKSTHPIAPDREIRRMKRVRLHELQHPPINQRPLRLHQIQHKRLPLRGRRVQVPDRRVKSIRNNLQPNLTFEKGVGVVEHRIHRVRRVPVPPLDPRTDE
jgi:hypothetical protein